MFWLSTLSKISFKEEAVKYFCRMSREAKLELNLQLAEEKRRNAQLQMELSNAKLTQVRCEELPSPLLVDVSDNSLNVADAENISTPHAPSRVEGKFETRQSITDSCPSPLVEIRPSSSFAGVPPRQDNTLLTACDFQISQSSVPLPAQPLTSTQTLASQSVLAGPQILWPTQYNLPQAGAPLQTDEHLQQSNLPLNREESNVVSMNSALPQHTTMAQSLYFRKILGIIFSPDLHESRKNNFSTPHPPETGNGTRSINTQLPETTRSFCLWEWCETTCTRTRLVDARASVSGEVY